MNEKIKVSIILPTYNGAKYIKQAIESILTQSYPLWELIILNDGSSDNTENIVKEYINKDKRIIYLKDEINLGVQKSLNKGLKEARGEYIARIDDDDEWINKDKLQKQVKFLDDNHDYVLIGTNGIVVDEKRKKLTDYDVPETDELIRISMLLKNPFIQSSILTRKNILLEIGGYSEEKNIKNIEDYQLSLRIGLQGKLYNMKEPMVMYMIREGNISSNNKKDILRKNIDLIHRFKGEYSNYGKALLFACMKFCIYFILQLITKKKLKDKIYKFLFKKYRKLTLFS
jgi:glycosyltransferase involved in cell wall biosynthesis